MNRVGDKLFLDKRSDAPIDYVTCMETANDFGDDDKDSIHHPFKLMNEATYINQAFSQQVPPHSRAPPPANTRDPPPFPTRRGPLHCRSSLVRSRR